MFGSDVLDVAVGMVLVFLMMSVIMTAVQEALEGWLKSRATHLEEALLQLVQGDRQMLAAFYAHPLIYALYRDADPVGRGRGPTYIPREAFSAALIDLVERPDTPVPEKLRQAYQSLKDLTGADARRMRREVEGWYDGAMDRASGWFKRHTQRNLFVMGLAAAIILNVNAVTLAQFLNANKVQREQMIALAQTAPEPATMAAEDRRKFQEGIYAIGLPVGWNAASRQWTLREFSIAEENDAALSPHLRALTYGMAGLGLIVGYLITALATMLGAPFWFDILNRLMVIRSTVKPKEKSPDEPSQDGGRDKNPGS